MLSIKKNSNQFGGKCELKRLANKKNPNSYHLKITIVITRSLSTCRHTIGRNNY